jgi:ABC-type branched-subunit amino acid transport system substrate-binding protein
VAIDAYFQYINDRGGIHGRKLVLVSRDDSYDPARTVQAARELTTREDVFALVGGVGTANGLAALPIIRREGIPWISPATGSELFAEQSDGLIYATFTNYVIEASLLARYAVNELGSQNIAMFYQNDGYGQAGLRGLEEEIQALDLPLEDVTVGDKVSYERGETNMAVQALRLKGSGADTVVLFSDPSSAASLLNEFERIDYRPQILASVTLLDPNLLRLPRMQGALMGTWLRLPSVVLGEGNGDPVADRLYGEVIVQYAPQIARDPFRSLAGIAFAQPLVEALERAGPELTRESLITALQSIDSYPDGLFADLDFSDNFQGNSAVMLMRMTPEGLRPVTDFLQY